MSESAFRSFAESKGFRAQTLSRWLSWQPEDRLALARLALPLKISENHLREVMDWCEEIALRDGGAIAAIFAAKSIDDIVTDPRLGRADKVKKIKETLRRLRFPRMAQAEDQIDNKIRALKLHPEIRVTVLPGLEGGRVQVEFSVTSPQELKRLAEKLATAAETGLTGEIFALLSGAGSGAETV